MTWGWHLVKLALGLLPAFLLAVLPAHAASFPLTWRWSNPTPHGNNIIDVAGTNQFWIQVAERGQIYTSDNLAVWMPRDSHTVNALRAVTFFKDQIVIVGENGTILTGPSASELQLINLNTSDWLEGVAASPQLVVAVGDNAAIYTTTNGVDWQIQRPSFSDWLRSVAFGTPGAVGMFVAVGEEGFIATSTNGRDWTRRTKFTAQNLNRVEWFNGEFYAVGDAGVAFQSTSGTSWLETQTGATNTLSAFGGVDAARLIAGESEVRLRLGRNAWSNELSTAALYPPPDWTYLSASTDTNSFLLCGRTGMMAEGVLTTNGAVWIDLSESLRNWLWDVKRFPNLYIAVGDRATILSSVDGISWEVELPPDSAFDAIFLGIGGRTNLAIAVGHSGTIITSAEQKQSVVSTNSSGSLVTNEVSTLGLSWEAVLPRPTTNDLQGITVFGDRFVASGGSGVILTSPDAKTWSRQNTPITSFLSSVEAFPGGCVAVGRSGTILTSPDAITWTARPSGTANWIYRVRYLGGQLIAVGQNGTILTSSDGRQWSARASGTTSWLNDVQWLDNTYFVVGNQGTVLSSPDAATWTDRGTITGKSLFGAAHARGQLVVVGVEGVVLRTPVHSLDQPVGFVRFPIRPQETLFVFSGQAGQRFTLERSTNILEWVPGPVLEVDDSGTLFHTDERINSPQRQFFRTRVVP